MKKIDIDFEKLRSGEITKKQYEKFFDRYDKNFKKTHPSDRYDRKSYKK